MLIGLVFALLAVACGLAVNRALRVPLSLSPLSGLASMALIAVWCGAAGAPPLLSTGLVSVLAVAGAVIALMSLKKLVGQRLCVPRAAPGAGSRGSDSGTAARDRLRWY